MADLTRFVFRSSPGPDRHGDILDVEGWEFSNFRRNPVVLLSHQTRNLPIGRAAAVGTIGTQAIADIEFATTPEAQAVHELVSKGFLLGISPGAQLLEWEWIRDKDHVFPTGIHSHRHELVELSIAPIPADPRALRAALEVDPHESGDVAKMLHAAAEYHQAQVLNTYPTVIHSLQAINQLLRS